jgi:hypothetical protein
MAIWYILWPFGYFVVIWYIFPRFGILCQEKSGNPEGCQANFSRLQPIRQKPNLLVLIWHVMGDKFVGQLKEAG